jgi:hypothetical protein
LNNKEEDFTFVATCFSDKSANIAVKDNALSDATTENMLTTEHINYTEQVTDPLSVDDFSSRKDEHCLTNDQSSSHGPSIELNSTVEKIKSPLCQGATPGEKPLETDERSTAVDCLEPQQYSQEASTSSLITCASSRTKLRVSLGENDETGCEPSTSFLSGSSADAVLHTVEDSSSVPKQSDIEICKDSNNKAVNVDATIQLPARRKSPACKSGRYSCTFPNILKELSSVTWIKRIPCFKLVGSRECKYETGARVCVDLYIPLSLVDKLPAQVIYTFANSSRYLLIQTPEVEVMQSSRSYKCS